MSKKDEKTARFAELRRLQAEQIKKLAAENPIKVTPERVRRAYNHLATGRPSGPKTDVALVIAKGLAARSVYRREPLTLLGEWVDHCEQTQADPLRQPGFILIFADADRDAGIRHSARFEQLEVQAWRKAQGMR